MTQDIASVELLPQHLVLARVASANAQKELDKELEIAQQLGLQGVVIPGSPAQIIVGNSARFPLPDVDTRIADAASQQCRLHTASATELYSLLDEEYAAGTLPAVHGVRLAASAEEVLEPAQRELLLALLLALYERVYLGEVSLADAVWLTPLLTRKANFSRAEIEPVETGEEAVFAFERVGVLCIFNFSAQTIDLGPVELGPWGYAWIDAEEA